LQKDIIINVSEYETRLAILEDLKLVELLVERPEAERMVGDIYKGVVKDVLPGMQAAFVDMGIGKNAFLHVSDIGPAEGSRAGRKERKIEDVVKEGQEILVQVIKEPMGTKGPRVTSELSIPGRYSVLVPEEEGVRVSRKISNRAEKKRLKGLASQLQPKDCCLIVRTVAEGKTERELRSDVKNLLRLWEKIKKEAQKKKAPYLLHKEMGITSSIMRDLLTPEITNVVVDSKREYHNILSYLRSIAPGLRSKVKLYQAKVPLFDFYKIESEIDKMLDRKVWIKKGSYIVIDQTEAMVTIDVNTGRYVGKSDQEATILKVNLEAAKEIARQIRLRDIGGLIVIDFIDMDSRENRKKLHEEFKKSMRSDRSKSSILPVDEFGLVEMTREKIRPSLMYAFSELCPTCRGVGRILSVETLATKVERWFSRAKLASSVKRYQIVTSPQLYALFSKEKENRIKRLRRELKLEIEIIEDRNLPVDKYRIFSPDENLEVTDLYQA
jgi:ribonuclease G